MADEDLSLDDAKDTETDETKDESVEEGSGGSKTKLIIIIVAAVVLLVGGGLAAYFLLFSETDEPVDPATETEITEVDGEAKTKDDSDTDSDAVEEETEVKDAPPKGDAIYISIPEPFLVNIKAGKRSRMMQIKVQFMVRSKDAEEMVKQHMPLVRNDLLDFFSLANAKEVQTKEGRNALKDGALSTAREVMKKQVGFEAIEMVLFTGFVVQ